MELIAFYKGVNALAALTLQTFRLSQQESEYMKFDSLKLREKDLAIAK